MVSLSQCRLLIGMLRGACPRLETRTPVVLRLVLLLLSCSMIPTEGQVQAEPPDALLAIAVKRIEQATDRQQRFACDATILRELYRPDTSGSGDLDEVTSRSSSRLILKDRLHVEVAIFDGQQLFSWPGAGEFLFQGLDEMTGTGTSGAGEFGSFAISFLSDSDPASLRYRGLREWEAQQVAEYSYVVPLVSSHYLIKLGKDRFERAAYQGRIFFGTRIGDLRRLLISVPSPPAGSGVVQARVDTTYEPQANTADLDLYPLESTLAMALVGGNRAVNQTKYQRCHLFTSESKLLFDAPIGVADDPPEAKPARALLPSGLSVQSVMLTPVDSRTSYAGDLFDARVVESVKKDKHILIPKGAVLHGRIVAVEQQYYPRVFARVCLKFNSMEFAGKTLAVALGARAVPTHPTFRQGDESKPQAQKSPGVEAPGEHVATIWVFDTDHIRLDTRTVSLWETQ